MSETEEITEEDVYFTPRLFKEGELSPEGLTTDIVADLFRTIRYEYMNQTARSLQSAERRIGASELGLCRSYLVHMISETPADDERVHDEKLPAIMGTAYGDWIETAYAWRRPNAITQADFEATFPSGITVPGHADIIDPDLNAVFDGKTKDGLELVRRDPNAARQHAYQVRTYVLGLVQAGVLKPGARGFLVYADRSGKDPADVVIEVDCSDAAITEVDEFVGDAIYAYQHSTEAPKDMEYHWCERFCEFFSSCRGVESRAPGVIQDPEVKTALEVRLEQAAIISKAKKLKAEADERLRSVEGVVLRDDGSAYEVSQTEVQGSDIAYFRRPYMSLSVRKQRPQKRKKEE